MTGPAYRSVLCSLDARRRIGRRAGRDRGRPAGLVGRAQWHARGRPSHEGRSEGHRLPELLEADGRNARLSWSASTDAAARGDSSGASAAVSGLGLSTTAKGSLVNALCSRRSRAWNDQNPSSFSRSAFFLSNFFCSASLCCVKAPFILSPAFSNARLDSSVFLSSSAIFSFALADPANS